MWWWRVKWSNVVPSPKLGIVAIEKGAFGSPSTKIANFTFYLFYFSAPSKIYNKKLDLFSLLFGWFYNMLTFAV